MEARTVGCQEIGRGGGTDRRYGDPAREKESGILEAAGEGQYALGEESVRGVDGQKADYRRLRGVVDEPGRC